VIDAPLALAFSAGMVSTVNPCGFAMLPAYLALFVSGDTDVEVRSAQRYGRALGVIAAVSVGFIVVFGAMGLLFQAGARIFIDYVPWAALAIGAGLVVVGGAMWMGWRPKFAVPQPTSGLAGRRYQSMVGFGMSYGIASLSCTLPVFLSIVVGTANRSSWASGGAALGAYVAGMTVVLATATLSVAAAQHSILNAMHHTSRHVHRIAAVLLVITGLYIVYYWSWALTTDGTTDTGYGPIGFVERRSSRLSALIIDNWQLLAIVGAAAVGAVGVLVARDRFASTVTGPMSAIDRHDVESGRDPRHLDDCCAPSDANRDTAISSEAADR
jgi:cytochrome c-type biogenesis protein